MARHLGQIIGKTYMVRRRLPLKVKGSRRDKKYFQDVANPEAGETIYHGWFKRRIIWNGYGQGLIVWDKMKTNSLERFQGDKGGNAF